MFPKQDRIVKDKDIKRVFKKSKKSTTSNTFLYLSQLPNKTPVSFKLLIIIPKKTLKKATLRHRLKRRISGVFEDWQRQNILPSNYALIVRVHNPNMLFAKQKDIQSEILPNLLNLYKKLKRN